MRLVPFTRGLVALFALLLAGASPLHARPGIPIDRAEAAPAADPVRPQLSPHTDPAAPSADRTDGLDQTLANYRLLDTWSEVPWTLTAGRYGEVADIGSGPDGGLFVLDAYHRAVHVLAPDGSPQDVFPLPTPIQAELSPNRLDAGADGTLHVLWTSCERCRPVSQLDRLRPDGAAIDSFAWSERYADVAVRADGRIYLPRAIESETLGAPAVDVFGADGSWLESIRPPEMANPIRADLEAGGNLYVLQEVTPPATPRPGGGGGPRATPGPSRSDPIDQAPQPIPGVLLFAPDHGYLETVPFDFGIDVAAGPAGVFLARYGQVFALRETEPLTPIVGQRWTGRLSLEVPVGGGLVGGLAHCHFQGLIAFGEPDLRPAPYALTGAIDRPPLEGPVFPIRLDSGARVQVLQGRYGMSGQRPDLDYLAAPVEPQSVQTWGEAGDLAGQLGICGASQEAAWVRDVAVDGADVFTADTQCVTRRPDDLFPAWTTCLDGMWPDGAATQIGAISAENGRVAVLDVGAGAVSWLDSEGRLAGSWSLGKRGLSAPPVDIVLAGDRVYLAYLGQAELERRGLDGSLEATWRLADAPLAIAVDAEGRSFVLGRGGWAYRHAADGALEAAWPLPEPAGAANDIAVDAQGRVLVSFAETDDRWGPPAEISRAGIWVFGPSSAPPEAPPAATACEARPDKRAAPARIPLGDLVTVSLDVDGRCPDAVLPMQLAIVVDTSRSMSWGNAMDSAKQALLQVLTRLDPRVTQVALVTFDDAGALRSPLTRELTEIGRLVAALPTEGDTRMAEGIELARRALTGPERDPGAAQMILLVTDANPKDETYAALEASRAAGLNLAALVFEGGQRADDDFLALFEGNGGRLLFDPRPWDLAAFSDALIQTRPEPGLFESITVLDRIPANMRYVAGSAQPAAVYDPAAHALRWTLGEVRAATGLRLRYRLEPLEVGTWPTNIEALADYRDARGQSGELVFPVPEVEVYQPEPHLAYLPFLSRGQCLRPIQPVDVVLVLDASSSMAEPAAPGSSARKLDAAVAAAGSFLDLLRLPEDRAGLVAFSASARRLAGITGDRAALSASLEGIEVSTGTRIDRGLAEARAVVAAGARPGALPVVILLTDGIQNGAEEPVLAEAAALEQAGVTVYTIGLGTDVDRDLLRAVASSPDRYLDSPSAADLAAVYAAISIRLACGG